ncbi:MAG: YARHG domain-containing protein [Clostridia bacterium]|nr:YARHG domain-containing protein [Clostridia bacterium]
MKKIFIGIFIFAIISFLITGTLITMKTGKFVVHTNEFDANNVENQNNDLKKEKTLDLYGTYDQNDLKVESVEERILYVATPIEIPTISGLKNKEVENKINNDIRERIISKFNENLNKYTQVGHIGSYAYTYANFANVISIEFSLSYKEKGESKSETIFLNYELVNGERLRFEDLFVKNIDMHEILRKAFYKVLASNDVNASFYTSSYFDKESGEWKIELYEGYDEQSETAIFNETDYIPELSEHDVNKMLKSFMNSENKKFYFTPTTICIEVNKDALYYYERYVEIDFIDVAKDIVIYDKYLTEENLYENSNIGFKNLWTCTDIVTECYYETGFAENNLYYEILLDGDYEAGSDYPYTETLQILKERDLEKANKKLEEYRQIAKNNENKFYIATIKPYVWYNYNYKYQFNGYSNDEKYYNLLSNNMTFSLGCVDSTSKEEVIKDIIQHAREYRYDLGYLQYFLTSYEFMEVHGGTVVDERNYGKSKLYDARTLLERNSVESIFKKNVDYISVLEAEVKEDFERYSSNKTQQEIDDIMKKATFVLNSSSIELDGYDWNGVIPSIQFSDIDNELVTLYESGGYILSKSSVRKIEKSEIQNLSLDELNKAYNEIFARHGHSFNNKELKEYFENQSWYYPVEGKTVSLEELNEIERENLNIIKNVIDEKKK